MKSLRLLGCVVLVSAAACALPLIRGGAEQVSAVRADSAPPAPPIVQVREFRRSSAITVVAWDKDDPEFGLRASIARYSGKLLDGLSGTNHRLYMTPLFVYDMGGFTNAFVLEDRPLRRAGAFADPYACFYGRRCSAVTSVGLWVPDSLLRRADDSLVVTFAPRDAVVWTLALRHELVAAFLRTVDSVSAAQRARPVASAQPR